MPLLPAPVNTTVAFVVMEPVAASVHRWFGHGPGWVVHRDHHEPTGAWERNDAIPLALAAVSMVAFAVGVSAPAHRGLVWPAMGVSLYGLAYAAVHDVYIHRRLPLLPRRVRWLEPWRRAHLVHHRTGTAPFGVLVPLPPVSTWRLAWRRWPARRPFRRRRTPRNRRPGPRSTACGSGVLRRCR